MPVPRPCLPPEQPHRTSNFASRNSGEGSGVSTTPSPPPLPPSFENAYLARSGVVAGDKKQSLISCHHYSVPWQLVLRNDAGRLYHKRQRDASPGRHAVYLTSVVHCTPSSRSTAGFTEWVECRQIRANGPNPASHVHVCDL